MPPQGPSTSKTRRAFSQVVRPSPIDRWGAPADAAALEGALDVSDAHEDDARALTHGFHPYPARMFPLTARRSIELLLEDAPPGPVLDPFAGSGTVLVEALVAGRNALGVDANPLAVALARAKTAVGIDRRALVDLAHRIAMEVYAAGKDARRAGGKPPAPEDQTSPRAKALKGWFQPHVRRELEALLVAVRSMAKPPLVEPLELVLTSLLVKLSRRTSDTKDGKVERQLGRGMATRLFAARAEELAKGLDELARANTAKCAATVHVGDARKLTDAGVPAGSAAAIVTSPPYAGTYDYEDQHVLRLAFLDRDEQEFAKAEIGARRNFEDVGLGLARWERDLGASLAAMSRALKPGGRAIVLIGDSLAGVGPTATAVFADDVLAKIAPMVGFTIVAAASQARLALGGVERRLFSERPKREHLVLLTPAAPRASATAPRTRGGRA